MSKSHEFIEIFSGLLELTSDSEGRNDGTLTKDTSDLVSFFPEIHSTLRDLRAKKINWKEFIQSNKEHIPVECKNENVTLPLERILRQIAGKPIVICASINSEEDLSSLEKLTKFLSLNVDLFRKVFCLATVCLVRVEKGRPVIELNAYEADATDFLSNRLELESMRNGNLLRSFNIHSIDQWLSVTLNFKSLATRNLEGINQ